MVDTRDAVAAYEAMRWGRRPERLVDVHLPPGAPAVLAELGRLVDIELTDGTRVVFPGEVYLAVGRPRRVRRGARRRASLYIVGPVPVMTAHTGRIHAISYQGEKGADPTRHIWRHEFAEQGGARPRLERHQSGEARIERAGSAYNVKAEGIIG